jgi:hypothetical protein
VPTHEQALRRRVYPTLEHAAFYRLRRIDFQDLVDRLLAAGSAPATIGTTMGALGVVYAPRCSGTSLT